MKDFIPIISAVIAFLGTTIGIYIGYRKWRRDRESDRFGQFEKDRQQVYKELWERIARVEVKTRLDDITTEQFADQLKELNSFMLINGVYFDDEDRSLANEFSEALYSLQKIVRASGEEDLLIHWALTQKIERAAIEGSKEIEEAFNKTENLRKRLKIKVAHLISGNRG